jgi:hypothetical protein
MYDSRDLSCPVVGCKKSGMTGKLLKRHQSHGNTNSHEEPTLGVVRKTKKQRTINENLDFMNHLKCNFPECQKTFPKVDTKKKTHGKM